MNDAAANEPRQVSYRFYPKIYGMTLVIALVTVVGLVGVSLFAARERDQAMRSWQEKLNILADGRASELEGWVGRQFHELGDLADNPALQLSVADLVKGSAEPGQKEHLRNLLAATAERAGFTPPQANPEMAPSPVVQGGMALVDKSGKVLIATPGMPPLEGKLAAAFQSAPEGEAALLDFIQTPTGQLQLGFAAPIYGVQGERTPSERLGAVLAVRPIDERFFTLLTPPGTAYGTLEVSLVRPDGANILYLSPLKDGAKPMMKRLAADPATLDTASVIQKPGQFQTRKDYRSREVFTTGRAIENTPWTMAVSITKAEALAESAAARRQLVTLLLLAVATVVVTLIAVWRHSTSRKAFELSQRTQRLAERTAAQEKLLRLVTDNQPDPVFIVDVSERVWFANRKTAEVHGVKAEELLGKTMTSIMGPDTAKRYAEANAMALEEGRPFSQVRRSEGTKPGEKARVMRIEHIPLPHIPVEPLPVPTPGVLIVEQEITDAVSERERRLQTMQQLVETLVQLVDRRDPYAAYHSVHVSRIAREVALEMALDTLSVETTELAGKLMNIGKIALAPELLTKAGSLDVNEKQSILSSLTASAELLRAIPFDGPVVDTLKQAQENWDGSGPRKLSGNDILVSARIVAAVNSFVGMVSPRAYRKALPIDDAMKILVGEMDKKYDRRVVVALLNYLDTHNGREILAETLRAQGIPANA